ncbi:unnamed protein product [Discula destructiva]
MGFKNQSPAEKAIYSTLTLSFATSITLLGITAFLINALVTPAPSFPIPSLLSTALILSAAHLLGGCIAFMVYHTNGKYRPKPFFVYIAVCGFLLFESYSYTAVGTWGGVNGNGMICGELGAQAKEGGLVGEVEGWKGRDGFGVTQLMGLDGGTCGLVKATWALLVVGGVMNLLVAVAAYFLHSRKTAVSRKQRRQNGNGNGFRQQQQMGYGY